MATTTTTPTRCGACGRTIVRASAGNWMAENVVGHYAAICHGALLHAPDTDTEVTTMGITDGTKVESAEVGTHRIVLTYRPWMGWSVHTVRIGTHDCGDARNFRDDEAAARAYGNQLWRRYRG